MQSRNQEFKRRDLINKVPMSYKKLVLSTLWNLSGKSICSSTFVMSDNMISTIKEHKHQKPSLQDQHYQLP